MTRNPPPGYEDSQRAANDSSWPPRPYYDNAPIQQAPWREQEYVYMHSGPASYQSPYDYQQQPAPSNTLPYNSNYNPTHNASNTGSDYATGIDYSTNPPNNFPPWNPSPYTTPYNNDTTSLSNQVETLTLNHPDPALVPKPPAIPDPLTPVPGDQDRGVLGALGGGAAGAYAGHKLHHGFLGALGGALAGHKIEDAMKDAAKKKKKQESIAAGAVAGSAGTAGTAGFSSAYAYEAPQGPPPMYQAVQHRGNFSMSSKQVRLDNGSVLTAICRTVKERDNRTQLSLDKYLGNDNGRFLWVKEGGNFSKSARNISLTDGGRVLMAQLRDREGKWRSASVLLDERLGNDDGKLVFVE